MPQKRQKINLRGAASILGGSSDNAIKQVQKGGIIKQDRLTVFL